MRRTALSLMVAIAFSVRPVSIDATGTHNFIDALMVMRPQVPSVGQPWNIEVTVIDTDGLPHPARRVHAIAEMTGHPMRPESVELLRADGDEAYSGRLVLTMAGPWRITVRTEEVNDVMAASVNADASSDGEPGGALEMRTMLQLRRPVHSSLVSPTWLLIATVVLTGALQITARVLTQRRQRTRSMAPQRPAVSV